MRILRRRGALRLVRGTRRPDRLPARGSLTRQGGCSGRFPLLATIDIDIVVLTLVCNPSVRLDIPLQVHHTIGFRLGTITNPRGVMHCMIVPCMMIRRNGLRRSVKVVDLLITISGLSSLTVAMIITIIVLITCVSLLWQLRPCVSRSFV